MAERYELLPNETLEPQRPVSNVELERQAEMMRELRELQNAIPQAQLARDRLMQRWAVSGSLSRHDMAVAVGLAKSRVDQIIRDLTLADEAKRGGELFNRMIRHLPENFDWSQLGADVDVLFKNDDYVVLTFMDRVFVNGQQTSDEVGNTLSEIFRSAPDVSAFTRMVTYINEIMAAKPVTLLGYDQDGSLSS
jgi:hypothetical protein